ncbi:MAG TPA: extracellular solute-binding protein [Rhabdochlamydiaceae bacterium]|nr:extracellular solute-binding protein [Rhabdochlamydiaceae bacterium]
MKKVLIRSSIILLWLVIIFTGLYWPKFKVLQYEKNSITVFTWGDILEPTVIEQFEKDTGIKVYLNYYSSNEELLVKLKATRGEGYDLVVPSDYAVKLLAEDGLLKTIDKSRLAFWNALNPRLLGHFYDPENNYSTPFEWELFGLGIDKDYFETHTCLPSWKMIFDKSLINYKISMINDPIEAVQMAAFYLYGPINSLTPEQTPSVVKLLMQQKEWVEAYANFRGDYFLATKNCPVVVASSSYIWKTMRIFPFVRFVLPQEGTFITIENLSIPAASDKEKLVYQFINYLYRPQSVVKHYTTFGFFPATLDAMDMFKLDPETQKLLLSSEEDFKKFHFAKTLLPQQQLRDIWVEVKSVE